MREAEILRDIETIISGFCATNKCSLDKRPENSSKAATFELTQSNRSRLTICFELEGQSLMMASRFENLRSSSDSGETAPSNSKLNIPFSMVKQDNIEEILYRFFPQIGQANSQFFNMNSFQINREKMPSFTSIKSDQNYCLSASSVCFDWSPDDNLFVYNNPRLSKAFFRIVPNLKDKALNFGQSRIYSSEYFKQLS